VRPPRRTGRRRIWHDAAGHAGHELKQFLVRLLFCLFAEDNGIFPTRAFQLYIEDHTAADGSDLGPKLGQFFDVLNTPEDRRQRNLDPDLLQFAYINGTSTPSASRSPLSRA